MKRMKHVIIGLLALGMIFTMTACGGKEQTVTYQGEMEENGLKAKDTMTFSAKGDTVEKLTEVIEFDISSFEDDVKEQLNSVYEELAGQYTEIEGVSCKMTAEDNTITFNIDVDTTGDAVKELTSKGLLDMAGGDGSGKISLKASEESLKSNGYTKSE